jgi:hypothetical protein
MGSKLWVGALAVLGVLVIASPWTLAPVCEVHGSFVQTVTGKQLPMPCGYTARAEIGVGALMLVTAGAVAFGRSAETKKMIGAFGIALGALAMLFPTVIIGMCAMADHSCRTMTQPTLMLLGLGAIVVSGMIVFRAKDDVLTDARSALEHPLS